MQEPEIERPPTDKLGDSAGTRFPIAAVGASAGGLLATSALLKALGEKPGVALVVIQHLDPARESSLAELLSRSSAIPVEVARSGMAVEVDHAYVMPPNAALLLVDGQLQLVPRMAGSPRPIDQFFESMAESCGGDSIGVVLSGTGQDGTEGVRAIKLSGGVTFAQDATAEHRGMPESATASGCIDFVLPPEEIAAALVRLGSRGGSSGEGEESHFTRVLAALRKQSQIDFESYKRPTLRRRIGRRIAQKQLASLEAYADLVERDSREAAFLAEDVLIHVTTFFRDPQVFAELKSLVFSPLMEHRPRGTGIRVWVPGCSSGEEVYSLAISLLELVTDAGLRDLPITIFGTDVSFTAIEQARAAQYPSAIVGDVSEQRLQRFFTQVGGGYRIQKHVRDLCIFAKHDATHDPPFARVDLISCRNLMIYLGAPLQERLIQMFHYALNEPGFLLLGPSETPRGFPGFAPVDARRAIYKRTSAVPRMQFELLAPKEAPDVAAPTALRRASTVDVSREADRVILSEVGPPGVVVTEDLAIVQFRGKTGAFLEPAPGAASFELMKMVREELRVAVRRAIDDARTRRAPARSAPVSYGSGDKGGVVEIEVLPFGVQPTQQRFFAVLFRSAARDAAVSGADQPAATTTVEDELRGELASTRNYLQSVIEQSEASNEALKAANEEIVSSNEELRSTNEELRVAKEEVDAANEELRTLNEQMRARNVESARLNDDLANVLSSAEIPIVILGRDDSVRRYTPAAARWLSLAATQVGGRLATSSSPGLASEILQMSRQVLQSLAPAERVTRDASGRWFQVTVRPYLTVDNRVEGTVVCAIDVDATKRLEEELRAASTYAEGIVDTVRECLVVVSPVALTITSVNRAFETTFGVSGQRIRGQRLVDLDGGTFDVPLLLSSVQALAEDQLIEHFRLERAAAVRPRGQVFELSARRIRSSSAVLLALRDVTGIEKAAGEKGRTERSFRDLLSNAADAVLMTDASGRIEFANLACEPLFGYLRAELLGMSIDSLLPEPMRAAHASYRAEFVSAGVPRQMGRGREVAARRKDGKAVPVEIVLGFVRREEGDLIAAFVRDVRERKESEILLERYQRRLRHMAFDAAIDQERERRRIAIDLHDRIGQALALSQLKLSSLRETLPQASASTLSEATQLIAEAIADTRDLTFELSPPVLYDLGLLEALRWLGEELQKRHDMQIEIVDDGLEKPLDPTAAALLFRAVRELLMNVLKHAGVREAKIELERAGNDLEIKVSDHGVGFEPESGGRGPHAGFGLFSVREQVERLGGSVRIDSSPGEGACVHLRLPIDQTIPMLSPLPESR